MGASHTSRPGRRWLLALGAIVVLGCAAGAAVVAKRPHPAAAKARPNMTGHSSLNLTSLDDMHFVGTTPEATAARWAQRHHALAMSYDIATRRSYVLLPPDGDATGIPPTLTLVRSRYTKAEFDAAVWRVLTSMPTGSRSHPAATGGHGFGVMVDAATGQLILTTAAPPSVTAPLQHELGAILRVENGGMDALESR